METNEIKVGDAIEIYNVKKSNYSNDALPVGIWSAGFKDGYGVQVFTRRPDLRATVFGSFNPDMDTHVAPVGRMIITKLK